MKNKFFLPVLVCLLGIYCCSCAPKPQFQSEEVEPTDKHKGCIIWRGDRSSRDVFLTFDDGPSSEATVEVLDILKKNNIKATFFVLGKKAAKHPDIVKRIRREGHDIGNHTFNHAGGLYVTLEVISKELNETDKAIKKACGSSPKFFRPPFGFFNYRYFYVAEKLGYRSVLWTIDAADWNKLSTREIESRLIPYVSGGSIVLLHDGGENRREMIAALPLIIKKLKAKGLQFKPLSALAP